MLGKVMGMVQPRSRARGRRRPSLLEVRRQLAPAPEAAPRPVSGGDRRGRRRCRSRRRGPPVGGGGGAEPGRCRSTVDRRDHRGRGGLRNRPRARCVGDRAGSVRVHGPRPGRLEAGAGEVLIAVSTDMPDTLGTVVGTPWTGGGGRRGEVLVPRRSLTTCHDLGPHRGRPEPVTDLDVGAVDGLAGERDRPLAVLARSGDHRGGGDLRV